MPSPLTANEQVRRVVVCRLHWLKIKYLNYKSFFFLLICLNAVPCFAILCHNIICCALRYLPTRIYTNIQCITFLLTYFYIISSFFSSFSLIILILNTIKQIQNDDNNNNNNKKTKQILILIINTIPKMNCR